MQRKSSKQLLNIYFIEIITLWEKHLQSSQEINAWGIHIDNGCYQGKLLNTQTATNSKESNQKMFQIQKIPYQCIFPSDKTTETRPVQVTGTDFSGAIMYCNKKR